MSKQIDGSPVDNGGFHTGNRSRTGSASDFAARLRRFLRCDRGVAAVEFGLSAPVLLAVLLPVADLGMAFSTQQQLEQAVQAGALYAASHPWNQNAPSAIASAVTAATALSGISVSPDPYQICGCPSGGSTGTATGGALPTTTSVGDITTVTCGNTCGTGETAGYYVVISARLPYAPVVPYSLLGGSTTLSAQSMIRIR